MPKILRIINRFNIGGPTYNAANLTKFLPDEYETLLVGGMKDESEDGSEHILNELEIKPRYIKHMHRSINLVDDYKGYREIKALIKEFQPDIVHTHASKAGTLGRLAAYKMNVPVIVHTFHGHVFHSYFGKVKTSLYKSIERFLARRTSKIVAISEIQKNELSQIHKIAPPSKFEVVNLGFNLKKFTENKEGKRAKFRSEFGISENEIAIGIVGRLVPIKNHALFITAIANLRANGVNSIRAFIIGDGELRDELSELCKELDLDYSWNNSISATIQFTSWIKDMDQAYPGLDVVALSSLNEGTPVTLIEAQACGLPIVSTNVGGIEDIVLKEKTALLSPSQDLEAFSSNLQTVVCDNELRANMSGNGVDFALEKFSHLRLANDMAKLYESLLNNNT